MMAVLYGVALALVLAALLVQRVRAVRKVRYDQRDAMLDKYAYLLDDPSRMTYFEAEEISKYSSFYEMPWTVTVALSFALFKTYAIPTISRVLTKSGQLSDPANSGRRAEETAVVINELSGGGQKLDLAGIDTERGSLALARMNWLHSRYGNLITRDDKLFTLALFIFEPFYFCEKFDYRPLTELEKEARYVHWREIGARMGIEDIPGTRAELLEWTTAYGLEKMVYDERNGRVGDSTFSVLLKDMPKFMWPLGKQIGMVLLDDHMLAAFGWNKPPAWMYWLVPRLLRLKAVVCGNFLFPRTTIPPHVATSVRCAFAGPAPTQGAKCPVSGKEGQCPASKKKENESSRPGSATESENEKAVGSDRGKVPDAGVPVVQRGGHIFEPFWVPPGGPTVGALGLGRPGKPEYKPEGYVNSRLGPPRLYNQGVEITLKNAAEMRERAQGGKNPFFVPKAAKVA